MGLISSSHLNNVLLRRYGSAQIIRVTFIVQAMVNLVLTIGGTATGTLGLFSTILLIFFISKLPGVQLS